MTESTDMAHLSEDRREIYDSMTKAARTSCGRICKKVENHNKLDVMTRHEIGVEVVRLTDNERKYGQHAVQKIAEVIGGNDKMARYNELLQYRQFANVYTKQEAEALLAAPRSDGSRIRWTHFAHLISLQHGEDAIQLRKQLEVAVMTESLTTTELLRRMRVLDNRDSADGPKPRKPKSVKSATDQVRKVVTSVLRYDDSWQESLFDAVDQAAPEECDEKLLTKLTATRDDIVRLNRMSTALLTRINDSVSRVERVMDSDQPAAEEEEEQPVPAAARPQSRPRRRASLGESGAEEAAVAGESRPAKKKTAKKKAVKKTVKKKVAKKKGARARAQNARSIDRSGGRPVAG